MSSYENANPQGENFSNRIKLLRLDAGLTQEELGARFSLGKVSISQYENGLRKPSMNTVARYASYFNVSADYLLGLTDRRLPLNRSEYEEQSDQLEYTICISQEIPVPFRFYTGESLRFKRQSHAEPGNIVEMVAEDKSWIALCLSLEGTPVYLVNAGPYRVFPQEACQVVAVATEILLLPQQTHG